MLLVSLAGCVTAPVEQTVWLTEAEILATFEPLTFFHAVATSSNERLHPDYDPVHKTIRKVSKIPMRGQLIASGMDRKDLQALLEAQPQGGLAGRGTRVVPAPEALVGEDFDQRGAVRSVLPVPGTEQTLTVHSLTVCGLERLDVRPGAANSLTVAAVSDSRRVDCEVKVAKMAVEEHEVVRSSGFHDWWQGGTYGTEKAQWYHDKSYYHRGSGRRLRTPAEGWGIVSRSFVSFPGQPVDWDFRVSVRETGRDPPALMRRRDSANPSVWHVDLPSGWYSGRAEAQQAAAVGLESELVQRSGPALAEVALASLQAVRQSFLDEVVHEVPCEIVARVADRALASRSRANLKRFPDLPPAVADLGARDDVTRLVPVWRLDASALSARAEDLVTMVAARDIAAKCRIGWSNLVVLDHDSLVAIEGVELRAEVDEALEQRIAARARELVVAGMSERSAEAAVALVTEAMAKVDAAEGSGTWRVPVVDGVPRVIIRHADHKFASSTAPIKRDLAAKLRPLFAGRVDWVALLSRIGVDQASAFVPLER